MALQLSGEEFVSIRDDFLEIDKDGDGQLTRSEMQEYLKEDKHDKADFWMKLMDLDCNGVVEFHEFLEMAAFMEFRKGINECKLKQMFRALDKDGNGFLSTAEMMQFFEMMYADVLIDNLPSLEEIVALIKSLDTNDDGKIIYEEFVKGFEKCLE